MKGGLEIKNNLVKTEIDVNNNKVGIIRVGDVDYISLTDLARYADMKNLGFQLEIG